MFPQLDPKWKEWGGNILFVVVLGPVALVWVTGLFGFNIVSGLKFQWFGLWFMASLTACGCIAFASSIYESMKFKQQPEYIWLFITGALTYWWGTIVYDIWNEL